MATLIDSSTISSVQRALGFVPISEPNLLDMEHVALGRFVEAFLCHDQLVIPDNYKEEFSEQRKELLDHPSVSFSQIPSQKDREYIEAASGLSETWTEAFQAQKDDGLFNHYFEQVQAFSHFLWEHSSSEFFLVFRALGIDKANPLIEAVLAENVNSLTGPRLSIRGADGAPVQWKRLAPHVKKMLTVLGWLGNQYVWHQVMAAENGHSYMPHPLRDFFAADFMGRIKRGATDASEFSRVFTKGVTRFSGKLPAIIEDLGLSPESSTLTIHSLLPLLIQESKDGADFITVLKQLRDESDVKSLRSMLSEVNNGIASGDIRPAQKLKADIEKIGENILIEKGLEKRYITLTPPTTLLGIGVNGDPASLKCSLPGALYKQFFVGKRYRVFIKRTLEELAVPSKMGQLKDKLNGYASIEGEGYPKFYLNPDYSPSKYHKVFNSSVFKAN